MNPHWGPNMELEGRTERPAIWGWTLIKPHVVLVWGWTLVPHLGMVLVWAWTLMKPHLVLVWGSTFIKPGVILPRERKLFCLRLRQVCSSLGTRRGRTPAAEAAMRAGADYLQHPRGSQVVLFWARPVFCLETQIHYPNNNYIIASGPVGW